MKEYVYKAGQEANNVSSIVFGMIGSGKRVLEVGCSSGSQTKVLVEEMGCEVTGIEVNPAAGALAKKFAQRIIIGSFESNQTLEQLNGEKFDVVLFADVLEHLYDPKSALIDAKSLLKDGGEVVASIPNIAHAAVVWELAHGRFNYQRFGLLDDTHIRFFTRRTIADMFEAAGLRAIEWRRFSLPAESAGFPIVPIGDSDAAFLAYITANNQECDTYQFVIRATAADGSHYSLERRINQLEDERDLLARKLSNAEDRSRKLQSNLDWTEANSPLARLKRLSGRILGR